MKLLSIKSVSAAMLTSVLLFSACTDLTDGLSTDPVNITDPSVISTDKFLSGVEVSLIGIYEADMNRLTGMWTGHFSGEDRQYIGLSNYGVSGRDFDTEWAGIYSSVLKNTQIVKSRAHLEKNTRMLAIAQVIEAMALGLAADLWGDVPFTEADLYPAISTPKFDPQASVYAGVQVLLDSAINNFQVTVPKGLLSAAQGADFFFAADPTQWTKVANTLKARFYLHTKDYANAVGYASLGIDDPADNMMAPHGTSYLQNFNLFYSFLEYDRPGYMAGNGYAAPLLDPDVEGSRNNTKTNESSRFNYLYVKDDGYYTLNDYNDYDYDIPEGYDGMFGAMTSFPMVTFEETNLIIAEANIKQGNFTEALDALNAHRDYLDNGGYWSVNYQNDPDYNGGNDPDDGPFHNFLPYVASDFNAGGIENEDGITANDALLREILEERYVTLTGQLEVFNDIRRTNNLLGVPVKSGNPSIPLRLLYPQSEINTNANVPSSDVGLFVPTKANTSPY